MPSTRNQRPYNVSYYRRNRQREIDRVMTRQRATLAFLRDLRRVPCMDCGGMFLPHQMDFDHRDPSTKSFQVTGPLLKSRESLLVEIAKCDIVCANCHAVRTYSLQGQRRAQRRTTGQIKNTPRRNAQRKVEAQRRDLLLALRDRPCSDCAQRFAPFVMQFDHRDPSNKRFLVCATWLSSEARILKEAAKCDIVCPNCHRDRTFVRRQGLAGVL